MQTDALLEQPDGQMGDHAELVRKLSMALLQIRALRSMVSAEGSAPANSQLRRGLGELDQMVGEILADLRSSDEKLALADPPVLPLGEALLQLVEETAETLGLSSRTVFSGKEQPLSRYSERLLYHIAREALARISTHVGARRLRFSLDYQEAEVVLLIEDDGLPNLSENAQTEPAGEDLPPFLLGEHVEGDEALTDHVMYGLRGMVGYLGGTLNNNSNVEQGTQVQVSLPYLSEGNQKDREEPGARKQSEPVHTTLLIVAHQPVSRVGLRRLLEGYTDLEVVGEAADSVQATSETAELLPQVVLLDAQLFHEQSLETLRQIHHLNPEIRVLLLTDQEDEAFLYEALRAGINGYVLKDIAPDELAQAVRAVGRGEVLIQPQLTTRLLTRLESGERERANAHSSERLTAREQEVLQLLARGLRNKEMAARLFVSERTINFHLANIYAKLHVSGRTEALSKALEQGLIKA